MTCATIITFALDRPLTIITDIGANKGREPASMKGPAFWPKTLFVCIKKAKAEGYWAGGRA